MIFLYKNYYCVWASSAVAKVLLSCSLLKRQMPHMQHVRMSIHIHLHGLRVFLNRLCTLVLWYMLDFIR
jgi:hypothetical protein